MQSARRETSLEHQVESRDVIGQAKGMLMAQSDINEDAAFDILRRVSQRLNITLVEVADDVVNRRTPGHRS
ncbi:MAG: ANTAR domain-containing protein [Acidimicrobiales bacterium]|nr:ANTAR domain-containing protein [Acidimicrobiales bacterium]